MNKDTSTKSLYFKVILNEYSSWDSELDEREKIIRDKEKELGIDSKETQYRNNIESIGTK